MVPVIRRRSPGPCASVGKRDVGRLAPGASLRSTASVAIGQIVAMHRAPAGAMRRDEDAVVM